MVASGYTIYTFRLEKKHMVNIITRNGKVLRWDRQHNAESDGSEECSEDEETLNLQ